MTKPTPGPWELLESKGGAWFVYPPPREDGTANPIKPQVRVPKRSSKETWANAYILAAAPELLEVARTFPQYPTECHHEEEPWYCDGCRHDWELAIAEWQKKREAAIAKAEGEPTT